MGADPLSLAGMAALEVGKAAAVNLAANEAAKGLSKNKKVRNVLSPALSAGFTSALKPPSVAQTPGLNTSALDTLSPGNIQDSLNPYDYYMNFYKKNG